MESVIDTNVLIASLIKEDVNHENARSKLNGLSRWFIPTIVFHELVWFLKSVKLDLKLALPFLRHEKCIITPVTKEDIDFSIKKARKIPEDYNDLLILSIALRLKKDLVTFDEELKREFERIKS